MKNMILILSVLFFFTGCNEEETKQEEQENSIYGTWQLVERYDGVLSSSIYIVENGEIITFSIDNIYSNDSNLCDGTYTINNSIIEISLVCLNNHLIRYTFSFENNRLFITPYPQTCPEGCHDTYTKIASK